MSKVLEARQQGNFALASAFLGEKRQTSGTPLPVNISERDTLLELGFDALEDFEGATDQGFMILTNLSIKTTQKVMKQIYDAQVARGTNNMTVLPPDFPAKEALIAYGYITVESLAGHDEKLLVLIPNVSSDDAKNIVKKYKELQIA